MHKRYDILAASLIFTIFFAVNQSLLANETLTLSERLEKKRMQAILDQKIKIPFEGVEAVFKTFGDENIYFFL